MKKLLIHRTKNLEKESKIILIEGKTFRHLIIFRPSIEHFKVIKKLQKYFLVNDSTCKAGLLIDDDKIILYENTDKMYNLKNNNSIYEL